MSSQKVNIIMIEPEKISSTSGEDAEVVSPTVASELIPPIAGVSAPYSSATSARPSRALAWIVGLWFALFIACQVSDAVNDKPKDAFFFAESYIRPKLKFPTTADFSPYTPNAVASKSSHKYLCQGWVDTKIGVGAKSREQWVCVVVHEPGKDWYCQGYQIGNYCKGYQIGNQESGSMDTSDSSAPDTF